MVRNQGSELKRELTELLKELHLPTVRAEFEESARRAQSESLSYEQYLAELVHRECDERRANRIARLPRQSKIPPEKSLAGFKLTRLPRKVSRQMKTLLGGDFLDRAENVLVFGKSGSGKTHLLCAIGQELIRQGRTCQFCTCSLLVQELLTPLEDVALHVEEAEIVGLQARNRPTSAFGIGRRTGAILPQARFLPLPAWRGATARTGRGR